MNRFKRDDSGSILLETVIVVPVFLLLAFIVVEAVGVLSTKQMLTVAGNSTEKMAWRNCAFLEKKDLKECLENVNDTMSDVLGDVLPGVEWIITVYKYESSTVKRTSVFPPSAKTSSKYDTKYSATATGKKSYTKVVVEDDVASLDSDNDTLIVTEGFLPYTPVLGYIEKIFKFNNMVLYETFLS